MPKFTFTEVLVVLFIVAVAALALVNRNTRPLRPSAPLLLECQPVVRTDPIIRVPAEQVTMAYGVTRYYSLEDSSFHQTTMPCASSELGGR